MSEPADYLIVGAGLTGATIARRLHDAGRKVLVIEARDRIGGNVADALHPSGIRYNLHGPHYFRTSSPRIRRFAERFASFYPFAARIMSEVGGQFFRWPLHREDAARLGLGDGGAVAHEGAPTNFEAAMLARVPPAFYDAFIGAYTRKQWGVDPAKLEPGLARRIEIRDDGDERLSKARFQGLPRGGYSAWVENMLAGIEVRLSTDFHAVAGEVGWRRHLIYTGPIDRFFDFALGRLPYRAQERTTEFLPGATRIYPCGQINVPSPRDGRHIRTIEWKHMMEPSTAPATGTLLTHEVPVDAIDWRQAEYPFPAAAARTLFKRYAALARRRRDILICGRLGEYRYLDMDQAMGRAMVLADRLLGAAEA